MSPTTTQVLAPPTPTTTSSSSTATASSYRLLYRGAISLPDSLLLLDGLTFAARLASSSPIKSGSNAFQLLDNPLALALESMRGRPTLRFVGVVKLREVWLDESGGVEMDIHPAAVLSQIYFENMFCLLPFPSPSSSAAPETETKAERSEIGIRVALGDSNGPETTHIVIFAQLVPASAPTPTLSSSSTPQQTITLRVGRITPKPPSPQTLKKRPPRPDDPIPRKPPAFFIRDGGGVRKAGSVGNVLTVGAGERGKDALKRVASANHIAGGVAKKQKVSSSSAADLGSGVRLGFGNADQDEGVFKVPELPNRTKASAKASVKGKEKEKEKDVFGDVSEVRQNGSAQAASAASLGGKGKQDTGKNAEDAAAAAAAFEKANKNLIKSQTLAYLARTKDPADPSRVIDKTHAEFKELYGFIYRGVGFALRAKMKTCTIDSGLINHLIGMHALMYLSS